MPKQNKETVTTQRRALEGIQIRHHAPSADLKKMALTGILFKAFEQLGIDGSHGLQALGVQASKIVGVEGIPPSVTESALEYLAREGHVAVANGLWCLTPKGVEDLKEVSGNASSRMRGVIKRHFPGIITPDVMEKWFRAAMAFFFEKYSTKWVVQVTNQTSLLHGVVLDGAVDLANENAGISDVDGSLRAGLESFLRSNDAEDNAQMWSFGQAAFAAKLIAIDIGPDMLAVEALRDSHFFLDTNALLSLALEGQAVAKCFAQLSIKCGRIERTDQEYENMMSRKRKDFVGIFSFHPDILQSMNDQVLRLAIAQGCSNDEDIGRMFETLGKVPDNVDGLNIGKFSWPELRAATELGLKDANRMQEIQEAWTAVRPYPKPAASLEHDAALHAAVESLRQKGKKAFVLTYDRSMLGLARRWAGQNSLPVWISLDTLIQVLAVQGTGPDFDPMEFAPLLARMIQDDLRPTVGGITPADLAWLREVEERTAAMPVKDVEVLARKVAHARLSWSTNDDALKLEVHRAYRNWSLKREEESRNAYAEVNLTKTALNQQIEKRNTDREKLINHFARQHLIFWTIVYGALSIALILLTLWLSIDAVTALSSEQRNLPARVTYAVMSVIATVGTFGFLLLPKWKNRKVAARSYGEKRASLLMGEHSEVPV